MVYYRIEIIIYQISFLLLKIVFSLLSHSISHQHILTFLNFSLFTFTSILKDVNGSDKESKTKSTRKCQSRMKELKAIHQRTAGLGALNQKDADWKLKQNAEKKKAKGYFTTTQDPDERKKQKNKKQDEKKNKFKEAAKTQGTGKKKKK